MKRAILSWSQPLAVLVALCATSANATSQPVQTQASSQLKPGDYTLGGSGQFRRLLVSTDNKVLYDVWRATPNGKLEHLHYVLISPSSSPVESDHYVIERGSSRCGLAGLRFYTDNSGRTYPSIIAMEFGSMQQPLGSSGFPVSDHDLANDRQLLARLAATVGTSGFYSKLSGQIRSQLIAGIPQCGPTPK